MGHSRRTFNRRLKDHGVTFADTLDVVRFEAAQQLLRDTDLAIGEIGTALGYAESSPFVRAFRRWSGDSPNAWRCQAKRAQRR
jgi:AraC-like DNA-binding protein